MGVKQIYIDDLREEFVKVGGGLSHSFSLIRPI